MFLLVLNVFLFEAALVFLRRSKTKKEPTFILFDLVLLVLHTEDGLILETANRDEIHSFDYRVTQQLAWGEEKRKSSMHYLIEA